MRRRTVLATLSVIAVTAASGARAAVALDGTWGGARGDLTAQVIITGRSVIGFYWRGDYLDAAESRFSPDGASLAFTFTGGHATLTRTGETTATIEITDGPRTIRLELRRD